MFDDHYKFAHLGDDPEALKSIEQLEQQLSEKFGSPITLIAYEKETIEQ